MYVLIEKLELERLKVLGVYHTQQEADRAKDELGDEHKWLYGVVDLEELRIRLNDVNATIENYTKQFEFKTRKRAQSKAEVHNLDKLIATLQRQLRRATDRKKSHEDRIQSYDSAIATIRRRCDSNYVIFSRLEERQRLLLTLARNELQEHRDAMSILDAYARNMGLSYERNSHESGDGEFKHEG